MTKEQLEALSAAIVYFDHHPARSAAFNLARALERLRGAEAKPETQVTPEAYETVCQRDSEWLEWARDTLGSEAGEITGGNGLRRALERRLRFLDNRFKFAQVEITDWSEWAADVTGESGLRPEEQRSEIAASVCAVRDWDDWADAILGKSDNRLEQRAEIARLVELGREAEGEIAGLRASLSNALAAVAKWEAWIDPLSGSSQIDAAKVAVERLVEMGRKSEDTEAKLRVCSEQFDAAMNDWGKAAELLGRIVKYADEDKVQTPGFTRLARAIEEAREMLRPAVPVKEPAAGELEKTDSRRSPGGEQENTDHAPTARHSGHLGTVPGHSELETMLTALMGPDRYTDEDAGKPWRWTRSRTAGKFWLTLDGAPSVSVRFPSDALAAINTRLAELAPKGWRLTVETFQGAWVVRYRTDIKPMTGQKLDMYADRILPVHGDLGARVTEALEWIADMEKPAEPVPDEPRQLTQAEVDALPDGTSVFVTWSGGNGPHAYILGVRDGVRYACTVQECKDGMWPLFRRLVDVGQHLQDQVWLGQHAPDGPITPPERWLEKMHLDVGVRWQRIKDDSDPDETEAYVTIMRDGTLSMRMPDGRVPEWLPQLQARAKQIFEKEGAK